MSGGRKRSVGIDPELYQAAKAYSEETGLSMSDALVSVLSGRPMDALEQNDGPGLTATGNYPSREYLENRFDRLYRNQREIGAGIAASLEGQRALAAGDDEEGVRRRQADALFGEAERQGLGNGGMRVLEDMTGFKGPHRGRR